MDMSSYDLYWLSDIASDFVTFFVIFVYLNWKIAVFYLFQVTWMNSLSSKSFDDGLRK